MIRKCAYVAAAFVFLWSIAPAAQQSQSKSFTGTISDSACGLHHTMGGSAKDCTLMCVQSGSKFVLADEAHQKVYALSDQAKAKPLAGEKVRVVGTLKGSTIEVSSITAAK